MPARKFPNILKKCIVCNKIMERPFINNSVYKISWASYFKRKCCGNDCRYIYSKGLNTGEKHWSWKGNSTKCTECDKEFSRRSFYKGYKKCRSCWVKKSTHKICSNCGEKTGDYHSKFCFKCSRGENRPAWKGGISKLSSLIRTLPENRNWIKSVFQRDNYTCQFCGERGEKANNLCADHIESFAYILKKNNIKTLDEAKSCFELWDIRNGRTLCRPCHRKTPNFGFKGYLAVYGKF